MLAHFSWLIINYCTMKMPRRNIFFRLCPYVYQPKTTLGLLLLISQPHRILVLTIVVALSIDNDAKIHELATEPVWLHMNLRTQSAQAISYHQWEKLREWPNDSIMFQLSVSAMTNLTRNTTRQSLHPSHGKFGQWPKNQIWSFRRDWYNREHLKRSESNGMGHTS